MRNSKTQTFQVLCVLIVSSLIAIKAHRTFIDSHEKRNEQEFNEKVYFPGRTNDDEVNLKRLANILATQVLREKNTNRIDDDDDESEERIHTSSNHLNVIIINANGESKPSSTHSDLNNNKSKNRSSSLITKVTDTIRNSSDKKRDTDEHSTKLLSSNRRNSDHGASRRLSPSSFEPSSKQTDFSDNKNNNRSASLTREVTDAIRNSSAETDSAENENKLVISNRRNSSQAIQRIPPPSVVSSASASEQATLRVCEIKYAEYIQRIFPRETDTATDANDKEFNGRVLAAPGQYPHMTALGFRAATGKPDYKCGGSLISENFVITAAHCTNITGLQPTKVRIGDLNLMVEESYLEPQIRNIQKIHVHPDYKRTAYYNDIALLELDKEIEFTEFARPIRLWTQDTLPFSMAYAMGYGSTAFARERTNRLTNLNMTIVPNDECNREMPKMPETERGILSSQICAKDYALNRDTCQGDSGGPLQFNIRGRKSANRIHYQLIGITSYGLYCRSGYPSIFTRVCSYLDWIEPIVWRDYFD